MIQRIQTVWMLVTAVLVGGQSDWWQLGWPMIMAAVTALVPLVAIFLFKNHARQTSLLIAEFVLLVGTAGFAIHSAWFAHTMWSYTPVFIFAAFVTNWLALRGVLRDTMLLKNADRLR